MTPELFPHQVEGVAWLQQRGRAILADDMGLGKSAQTLLAAGDVVLIVCESTNVPGWAREVELWRPDMIVETPSCQEERASIFAKLRGRKPDRTPRAVIITYSAVHAHACTLQKKKRHGTHGMEFWYVRWDSVIFDEAHALKNYTSQAGKAARIVSKMATQLYLTTGTPILNTGYEIWHPLHLIDPKKWSSFWDFAETYFEVVNGRYGREVLDVPQTDYRRQRFVEDISPYILRRENAVDLPELLPLRVMPIELFPGDREFYDKLERDMIAHIEGYDLSGLPPARVYEMILTGEIVLAKNAMDLSHKVRQATYGRADAFAGSKSTALQELARETESKIVVFSNYVKPMTDLARSLGGRVIHGGIGRDDRQRYVDRFKDSDDRFLFCTFKSAAVGLTITCAQVVVLMDQHWVPNMNMQAIKRLHRIGQTAPVAPILLQAIDTVDEHVASVVNSKKTVVDGLLAAFTEESSREP